MEMLVCLYIYIIYIYVYIYIYIYIYIYKAFVWESIILAFPPSTCIARTRLQYYCATIAQYTTSRWPLFWMQYNMQYQLWQYRVKAKPQGHPVIYTNNTTEGGETVSYGCTCRKLVCACTRACWCRRICAYVHAYCRCTSHRLRRRYRRGGGASSSGEFEVSTGGCESESGWVFREDENIIYLIGVGGWGG